MFSTSLQAGALALMGACALVCSNTQAQTPLLDEVHTVATADRAVPIEHGFDITGAGTYQVTLTDLGAAFTPSVPVGSMSLAITGGQAIVGTPLTAAGTKTFTASAGHYVVHVVGTPQMQSGVPVPGSGKIYIKIADSTGKTLFEYTDDLALATPQVPTSSGLLDDSFTVPANGDYTIALTDFNFPQSLVVPDPKKPAPATLGTLTLAVVADGTTTFTRLDGSSTTTITLQAGVLYHVFGIGTAGMGLLRPSTDPANPDPVDSKIYAGLYGVTVTPAAGGAAVYGQTVPVGAVALAGTTTLSAAAYSLGIADLSVPKKLSFVGALIAANGQAVPLTVNGQPVSQLTASSTGSFTATQSTYQVYAYGIPASAAAGGYTLALQTASGASALNVARAVSDPNGPFSIYNFDTTATTGGAYTLDLADFGNPAQFTSLSAAAVQGGVLLGTASVGSQTINPAVGPLTLLVFAQPPQGTGGLFEIGLTPSGASSSEFETTQGVGQLFSVRKLSITAAGGYQISVKDLAWPAAFANLSVIVSHGTTQVGSIVGSGGSGTLPFAASAGNYYVSFIAQPQPSSVTLPEKAGTYAMTVDVGPAATAPTVDLQANPASVASGGTVTLTWTTGNADTCLASGGWSGNQATKGSATSAAITALTAFNLACTGPGGTTTKSVTVTVQSSGGGGGGSISAGVLGVLLGLVILRTCRRPALPTALLALAVLTACGGAQSRFATHMKRGQDYLSGGEYSKANVEFRNAMQIQPKDSAARLMAGTAAERLGRPREAVGLYQAVVDAEPDNIDARAHLARVLIYSGAAELAMKTIEPALAKHPDDPVLLTLRGTARAGLQNEAGAVADLDQALQLAPANEDAIQARAGLYKHSGDLPAAIKLVSDAVQHAPNARGLREVLVDLYTLTNDPPHLEEQLHALIGLAPKETRYRYQLAIFYSRTQRPDEAQRTLEDAVKAFPRDDQAKLVLVDFISTQRKRADGEKILRDFVAKEPGDYPLRLGLGAFLQRNGDEKAAAAAYQEIVTRDGTGAQGLIARDRLAIMAWSQGRYEEAHKLVAEVLQKNPHDNEALTLNGEMALARSDPATAIGDLRGVLRDQPQAIGIHRLLARAYVENGQPGLAEETLRKALEVAPADTALRIELAQVLKQTQRVDQAVALLEEAVHNAPADAELRESLVRTYLVKRDFSKARTAAEDLKILRPQSPAGFYLAGLAAEGLNQPAEAQKQYSQGLAARPGTLELLSALARIQLRQGQADQAIALVKDAAQRDPANAAPVLNLLGELYLTRNNVALAEDALTRATQVAPKWWAPYRNLALVKVAKNDTAGAVAVYQSGIKVAPSEPKLVVELALLLEKQGRVEDAIQLYEGWYRQNPRAQLVANNLAMLLVTYKKDPPSLDRARDLTAPFASSPDGNFLDTNGWVHFKRAEYTEALPVLERAVAREPDSRQIRYHLGMAELRVGQTDRARTELEAAVAGEARFVGADEARATLATLKSRSG